MRPHQAIQLFPFGTETSSQGTQEPIAETNSSRQMAPIDSWLVVVAQFGGGTVSQT